MHISKSVTYFFSQNMHVEVLPSIIYPLSQKETQLLPFLKSLTLPQ